MAKNEVFKIGDALSLPVATGTKSGTPLRIGVLNGVAQTDEGSVTNPNYVFAGIAQPTGGIGNAPGFTSVKRSGSWMVPVAGVVANVGDPIYIKADGTLSATGTGAFLWGAALATKTSPTAPLHVEILQPGQVTANP
jgi:hypothetical protein